MTLSLARRGAFASRASRSPRCFSAPASATAQTLDKVKQRGSLVCGVSEGIAGFSAPNGAKWTGFDVDLCRALAAAVLGDAEKVRYVPLNANDRFARPAIRRDRRAVAQFDLDDVARDRAQARVPGGDLLRRPGLHDPPRAAGDLRARTRQHQGVRAERHHDRAQSRRFLSHQPHEARNRRAPEREGRW